MKKLVIIAALMMGLTAAYAQKATVLLNNYDADKPIFAGAVGTLAGTDVMWQLLGNGAPVTETGSGTSIFPVSVDAGYFDVGVGVVAGVTAGDTVNFELRAWKGADYASATESGSVSWSQATGSWNDAAVPPAPPSGPALAVPGSVLVTTTVIPEPSTIALGLLGLGALLIRRRK
jgi:hypothetical protein